MRMLGLCVALTGLGACTTARFTMTDDIDLTWDFVAVPTQFAADLHTPYVLGTKVTVFAHGSDDKQDFRGFTIDSSDASVFRIADSAVSSDGRSLAAHGQAMGEGTATLRLLDSKGHEVGRGFAEVLAPDQIGLYAHGSLILGRDDEAKVNELRVVTGGLATYLVRYFRGGRELHGNGVLTLDAPAGLSAEARTTFLFENREWLAVQSSAAGASALTLHAPGAPAMAVPVVTVADTAIADIVLLTQSEQGRRDGDWLVALAQAYDGAGTRIFGVDCMWKVDGLAQTADGDLYRYRFKQGQPHQVQALRGTHTDTTTIQSDQGYVSSSNAVGCAAGGGGGSLIIGAAGLLGRRRRAA
jgi:hypothetical protein